jgi:hypothetical protein
MGVDLRNNRGDEFSFATIGWAFYLNLAAVAYGWGRRGTRPPRAWTTADGQWQGAYDWNAGQIVDAEDAADLARALEEYLDDPDGPAIALEVASDIGRIIGTKLTVDEGDKVFLVPFIAFARDGEFEVW